MILCKLNLPALQPVYLPASLLVTFSAGSEYETNKEISTEIQSALGISANIHKGINFSQAATTPVTQIHNLGIPRFKIWVTGSCSSNMRLLKRAYKIHECI